MTDMAIRLTKSDIIALLELRTQEFEHVLGAKRHQERKKRLSQLLEAMTLLVNELQDDDASDLPTVADQF